MYQDDYYENKKRKESHSIFAIIWAFFITVVFIIDYKAWEFVIEKFNAGETISYLAVSITSVLFTIIITIIFLGQLNQINNGSLRDKYDKILEEACASKKSKKLKLYKLKEGKLVQIGYWSPRMPGTVNTCPKEWEEPILDKTENLKDWPKEDYRKN